ncbi:sn-glycerol-3-phosphate transporter [Aliidiomarina minuta]|uniref:sn-glycerol-3-phosphate transporter n=2 Tax=Aliidiomarina minuta TaxID=880057 RepID=A0A432W7S5_9GAMM|nr:sn-glycerol-3-phosphate transporter [Aliidiomarina minuta]
MASGSARSAELFYDIADFYSYSVQTSVWTTHFNPQPEHNNHQELIGIERFGDNFATQPILDRTTLLKNATPLIGISFFQNSYSQSTVYAYAGFRQPLSANQRTHIYAKITAGFIHGYRHEFQHKVPFNHFGISPAAVPSVGLQHQRFNAEIILFGASGTMINVGYSF